MSDPVPLICDMPPRGICHPTAPDVACEAVAAFMVDWNTLPPEDCAWRMYARLKTALAHMEDQPKGAA